MLVPDDVVQYLTCRDERLAYVINALGNIEIKRHDDAFTFLTHTVIEQMLSKAVAGRVSSRLTSACDGIIRPDSIAALSREGLRSLGISYRKADTLHMLALSYDENEFRKDADRSDSEVMARITAMPGLGPWSAKMYLLFYLGREDVLPYEDGTFLQSYKWLYNARSLKPSTIQRKCRSWRPYSSYAARYLYRALDDGLTKQPFAWLAEGTHC